MKPSCVFISLGRGAAVDEAALFNALTSGQIMAAACDVFATEPLPADSPLWDCENLLLTAHNADLTEDCKLGSCPVWNCASKPTHWAFSDAMIEMSGAPSARVRRFLARRRHMA